MGLCDVVDAGEKTLQARAAETIKLMEPSLFGYDQSDLLHDQKML